MLDEPLIAAILLAGSLQSPRVPVAETGADGKTERDTNADTEANSGCQGTERNSEARADGHPKSAAHRHADTQVAFADLTLCVVGPFAEQTRKVLPAVAFPDVMLTVIHDAFLHE